MRHARTHELQGAAPFTVRSTPDFENTNGMEHNIIT